MHIASPEFFVASENQNFSVTAE